MLQAVAPDAVPAPGPHHHAAGAAGRRFLACGGAPSGQPPRSFLPAPGVQTHIFPLVPGKCSLQAPRQLSDMPEVLHQLDTELVRDLGY